MGFDIRNRKERKVVCISKAKDGMMVSSYNHYLLEVGKEYTVVDVEVHAWYTILRLKEFPDKTFNSVVFADIEQMGE